MLKIVIIVFTLLLFTGCKETVYVTKYLEPPSYLTKPVKHAPLMSKRKFITLTPVEQRRVLMETVINRNLVIKRANIQLRGIRQWVIEVKKSPKKPP